MATNATNGSNELSATDERSDPVGAFLTGVRVGDERVAVQVVSLVALLVALVIASFMLSRLRDSLAHSPAGCCAPAIPSGTEPEVGVVDNGFDEEVGAERPRPQELATSADAADASDVADAPDEADEATKKRARRAAAKIVRRRTDAYLLEPQSGVVGRVLKAAGMA